MKVYIHIKRPRGTRKTFQMHKETREFSVRKNSKIVNNELDGINKNYLEKVTTEDQAYSECAKLRIKLLNRKAENLNKHYFSHIREGLIKNCSESSIVTLDYDLRAINKLFTNIDLRLASKHKIEEVLLLSNKKISTKNRYIVYINKYLSFIKRDIKLEKEINNIEFHYLTEKEFLSFVKEITDKKLYALARVLFYSGMRVGELFAFKKNILEKNILDVRLQLTRDLQYSKTKTKSSRKIYLQDFILEDYLLINKLTENEIKYYRNNISRLLLSHSRKYFIDKNKHISSHDLRHSCAMMLMTKNVSLLNISKYLGHSLSVSEKHYLQASLSTESLDIFANLFKVAS